MGERDLADLVREAVRERLAALRAHEPGTRAGTDPEDLHQLRVTVRRLRAVLAVAGAELRADWADELRADLGWLGRLLGPVRDADVLLERFRAEAAGFPADERAAVEVLLSGLVADRARARKRMLRAMRGDRYAALLDRVLHAGDADFPPGAHTPVDLLRTPARRLRRAVAAAGADPGDAELHEIRIRGKRLRYTAELVAPAGGKPVSALVAAVKRLQEVLGDHNDGVVAEARVRALLADRADPAVVFVAGRLVQHAADLRARSRTAWPDTWSAVAALLPR